MSPCLEFFHALTSEAPIPGPRPFPPIYIIFPLDLASLLSPHHSLVVLVSAQITVSILLDVLSLILLTSPEKSISVPSVLYRRAQISSQVCIKRSHLDLSSSPLIFFSGQPHLPFCAIRPFAFFSPFISPPTFSAPHFRPELNS